jgi:PST family polysaccharide transporter
LYLTRRGRTQSRARRVAAPDDESAPQVTTHPPARAARTAAGDAARHGARGCVIARILHRVRHSPLARNALTLYGAQAAGYAIPLLTLPYLARVLRPEHWGLVLFAQSFAASLTLLVEYGFNLSATRSVARVREDPRAVSALVGQVQAAKCVLCGAAVAVALVVGALVPAFRTHPELLLWATLAAIFQGMSPLWYFQGTERLSAPSLVELGSRAAAAAGVFLVVRQPGDGWMVLALQAVMGAAALVVTTGWMYRRVRFVTPRPRHAARALREAAGLFVFRSAGGVYTLGNPFLLGLLANPAAVALYGAAERIMRAAVNLLAPASQALYPRLSYLMANDRARGDRLVKLTLLALAGVGTVLSGALALSAPLAVPLLLGPGYEGAVPVVRVLAVLPLMIGLNTALCVQWALPLGLDRTVVRAVMGAAVVNVLIGIAAVPAYGAVGMAWGLLGAEAWVTLCLALRYRAGTAEAPPPPPSRRRRTGRVAAPEEPTRVPV